MRRGFTLIELSIAMCILLILYSVSIMGIKSYRSYVKGIKYSESIFEIEDFLSRAKGRAINENKSQKIFIEEENRIYTFLLVEGENIVDCLCLGEMWDIVSCNINRIDINKLGYIDSCTINMKKGTDEYKVTIQPGGGLVSDYKG